MVYFFLTHLRRFRFALSMKRSLTLIIWCLFILPGYGQSLSFTLKDYITLPRTRNLHGISGLEHVPARQEWQLAGDRGQYHTFRQLHQLTDWACAPDSASHTGLYLEAIRYDAPSDTYYFAVENDQESYVGFKRHAMPRADEPFNRLPLPHAVPAPKTNKGIEGLALTAGYLWVAPEAGSAEEATTDNALIHFYRYRKDRDTVVLDAEFSYEIDRNVCPGEALGGVSEIIAVPGEENHLLVLERCYEKTTRTVTAKLYEARADETTRRLIKFKDKPAFDFNNHNGFHPDNLEAMTWGADQDGRKVLLIVSDDNSGKSQWTQVITLEMQ